MKFVLGLSIVLLVTMSSPSAKATDSWTLYDNFNSEFLDVGKWGEQQNRTSGVVVLEEVRLIDREKEGQRFYIFTRAHGSTVPLTSGRHRAENNITFRNPNTIRAVKASIKVNEVEATQCPDSGAPPTGARIRFVGSFYNTGACDPPSSPPDQSCDVDAYIFIQRSSDSQDKPGILQIWGEVSDCTNSDCSSPASNYQAVQLGTIRVGQWATVSVEWNYDASNQLNQFIFQRDKEPPKVIPHDENFPLSPNLPFLQLGAGHRIPFCSERQVGLIGAYFENVFVKYK
jgi:hypothetical protein